MAPSVGLTLHGVLLRLRMTGKGSRTCLEFWLDYVVLTQTAFNWIGAITPDNVAAELTASIAAHITALALPYTSWTTIRPDLELSALISGAARSCTAHPDLVALARWLGPWFHARGGQCVEVRGHTAHPWE